jgi:hypothetical protein
MKKAFDQNVSRAKPRLRLGPAIGDNAAGAFVEVDPPESSSDALSAEIKARLERSRSVEPEPSEAIRDRSDASATPRNGPKASDPSRNGSETSPRARHAVEQREEIAVHPERSSAGDTPKKKAETPPNSRTGTAPRDGSELPAEARRQRLKDRLRAARENPRPEPLPATVAEAGALAVERISSLQAEVSQLKALNLTLTQDLESARRQAERATEEARIRMDEARRLASEMDSRAKLLAELERELASLEGERNEALLALQDARSVIETSNREKEGLRQEVGTRDKALSDSLAEEERLAGELEAARDHAENLRCSLEALTGERDVLARQVADLTAERAELLEARKALESVHRALTQAAVK